MQSLGHSRSAHRANHLLHTPDAFVRAPLPGMKNATAVIHAAPAIGAKFTQYTAEFEPNGELPSAETQRFVYVLEGELTAAGATLGPSEYSYLPNGDAITAHGACRATIIEKPICPAEGNRGANRFSWR